MPSPVTVGKSSPRAHHQSGASLSTKKGTLLTFTIHFYSVEAGPNEYNARPIQG